ncbi:defensin-1-like [Cicer arietinum]|uniref:Defensin-1-like n=1 Tax=Cicer arietinum TaxID=3827 RepID=A0A3Q7XEB4_CICAR|nr:defensin-1-like [Cicer arietinum]
MERKTLRVLFMLFLLLATDVDVAVKTAEGKLCPFPSKKFKGDCLNDKPCVNTCTTEGFSTGSCNPKCLCDCFLYC